MVESRLLTFFLDEMHLENKPLKCFPTEEEI